MHTRVYNTPTGVVNQESAGLGRLVKVPAVTALERIESARQVLGWTGRQLAREAGLKQESHYGLALSRAKGGGGVHVATLDKLIQCLVRHGWSEEWLRHGIGPQRQPVAIPVQPATVAAPPARRSFTPTPAPSSELRVSQHTHLVVPRLPNRERAAKLLVDRGLAAAEVDESLALVAFDARLAPCEDPPVSWWLDAMRDRVQRA
jgi:hypothetical protein